MSEEDPPKFYGTGDVHIWLIQCKRLFATNEWFKESRKVSYMTTFFFEGEATYWMYGDWMDGKRPTNWKWYEPAKWETTWEEFEEAVIKRFPLDEERDPNQENTKKEIADAPKVVIEENEGKLELTRSWVEKAPEQPQTVETTFHEDTTRREETWNFTSTKCLISITGATRDYDVVRETVRTSLRKGKQEDEVDPKPPDPPHILPEPSRSQTTSSLASLLPPLEPPNIGARTRAFPSSSKQKPSAAAENV